MSASVAGRHGWGGQRDNEGHRTWTLENLIRTTSVNDGPFIVMQCPGLPAIGSTYSAGNDSDSWAFCYPSMKVEPWQSKNDPSITWKATQTFSTKPLSRCNNTNVTDPLQEPMKIGGAFTKYTEEALADMNGNPIKSSSHELFRGKEVEFDANRPSVWIEQNVATLGLQNFAPLIDNVNDSVLWNVPARCIKLTNVTWERKLFGICNFYYTRRFEFDVNYNTFDRYIQDVGTKVLHGHWTDTGWALDNINGVAPNKNNPQHFDRFKDRNGECARVFLDGSGLPASTIISSNKGTGTSGAAGTIFVQKYPQTNLLTLGIPVSL